MLIFSRLVSRTLRAFGMVATLAAATAAVAQTAPVLIPYTVNLVAGNATTLTGGYSGDGSLAVGTTLNGPITGSVDAEGNVYLADTTNSLVREVNAGSGTIKIIAGLPPTGCPAKCTVVTTYGDGVQATATGLNNIQGLVVDGIGNVFVADYGNNIIRVIYKGGAQVANMIALLDPTVASSASAVTPGYIYTIAGIKGSSGAVDKVLATQAKFHDPTTLALDAAGNLYIQDWANIVVRVINMQPTAQTFYGVTLQPGYIGAIVNCAALTSSSCVTGVYSGVPAAAIAYQVNTSNQPTQGMGVDAWGNVYEVSGKESAPYIIYGLGAYSGIPNPASSTTNPLSHLLTLVDGNAPVGGDGYYVLNSNPASTSSTAIALSTPYPVAGLANSYNNWVLRGTAITPDSKGNLYMLDNHFQWILREDVNSSVVTRISGALTAAALGGTVAAPVPCTNPSTAMGSVTTPVFPELAGFVGMSTDPYGDGCPGMLTSNSGYQSLATDGWGSVYLFDGTDKVARRFNVNNQFPKTPVASMSTAVTQVIQLHFDASNLPVATGTAVTMTSPLTIESGSTDFTFAAAPTCQSNSIPFPTLTTSTPVDSSIDCVVPVTFNPSQPGLRQAALQATTVNGTYNFALSGIGIGPQLALDGGSQTPVSIAGLGTPAAIAIDGVGNQYIADTANNQILMQPISCAKPPCAATAIGKGFNGPQGLAVDGAGNVYVADTGNNRVVMISGASGNAQTVIGSGFNKPQGVAVDRNMNVYVADTGNKQIVEIPGNTALQQSVLFQSSTNSTIIQTPVAIAVDSGGNVYVSDTGARQIYMIPPGGGDLTNIITAASQIQSTAMGNVAAPGGLAVDAAGNIYVADEQNNVITEFPFDSADLGKQFNLSFAGLSAPGGLALDPSGNLYVADTGNKRVLMMNRTSTTLNFGSLGVFQPALTAPLTLTNIGNAAVTLNSPVYTASGNNADFPVTDGCSGVLLHFGLYCTVTAGFLPAAAGSYTDTLSFQGGSTATLLGTGVAPLAAVTTSFLTAPVTGGTTASVIATVTQPHGINTPTGTVTFVYTINEGNTARGGSTVTVANVPLQAGSNGAATAQLNLTGLLPARRYSIVAMYNGDPGDTANSAAAFTFTVPGGTVLTVVSTSQTFVYGSAVPALSGTVTGILPADAANITYTFVTAATPATNVGTYPITLLLSGGNYLNYVVPAAVTSTGAPAVVTETPAPLSVVANSFTVVYGSGNLGLTSTITGAVNGNSPTASVAPAGVSNFSSTSALDVGTYTLVPTLTGSAASNYKVTSTNGTLVITPAATTVTVAENNTSVLPTNLASEQLTITVGSGVSNGAIPGGTITLIDTFTPFSTGVANAPVNIGPLPLAKGAATYTPTSQTLGTHAYTATYNGSLDFQTASTTAAINLVVDHPDFFVTAPTTPIVVIPGTIPGGNAAVTGESAANPEQATVTLTPILGYTGTLTVSCSSPSSYVQCTLSPTTVTLNTATAQTTIISVQTPATLPVNYSGAVRPEKQSDLRWAFIPLGLLALLPLARRRKVTRFVWMLLMCCALSIGLSGCNITNLVKFYTPVPEGEQPVTITATDGTTTQTFTMTISIQ